MNSYQIWNADRQLETISLSVKVDTLRQALLKGSGVAAGADGGCICGDGTGRPCAEHAESYNALLAAREALAKAAHELGRIAAGPNGIR